MKEGSGSVRVRSWEDRSRGWSEVTAGCEDGAGSEPSNVGRSQSF